MKLHEIRELIDMIAWGITYLLLASILLISSPIWLIPYMIYVTISKYEI